jgi:type IV secretory pathway TraG/TraD family ATPase VirD4
MQSLWLDMLILKLQTAAPEPGQSRVWMVLDELASLNALPQLHNALTKQRKSDNPIVLGFQGMSQLDAIYGKKAETILSQAYTNIVLRTREPRAAKHLSELIGKAQLERTRESKPTGLLHHKQGSYSSERVVDPVVMESEIQGLEDLHGYFVQQDKVVPIRFRPQAKRNLAPALVERIIPPVQHRPLDPEPKSKGAIAGAQDSGFALVPQANEVNPEKQLSIGFDFLE